MKPDAMVWKDEGEGGPLWVRRNGELSNYKDSDMKNWNSNLPFEEA